MPAQPKLAGTVAVVEVGSPLGSALARRLAADGAAVVLVGADGARAGSLMADIERQGAGGGHFFSMEDGTNAEIEGLVEFLAEQLHR